LIGLEALVVAPAFPPLQRQVEGARVAEDGCGRLAKETPEAQRVTDPLGGDRILEVAGVARERPARPARAAKV